MEKTKCFVPIKESEISKAISILKSNKSPGLDHISNGMLKHGLHILLPSLKKLYNYWWANGAYPKSWASGMITTIHKSWEVKSRKYQGVFEVKSRVKTWQVRGIWSPQLEHQQVPKWGTEPGVRKGKRSLLASHTRCKCSMETTHNSVKVKLGIKVMKLVESLIGREVTVGQGSECHLTFVRGLLHIAQQDPRIDHKTSWMTISSVPQGIPVWVAYWKVAWPSE